MKTLRNILGLLALLFVPAFAGAQGITVHDVVLNQYGTPMPGATISVCTSQDNVNPLPKPCTHLVSPLHSDTALATTIANPLQADGLGNYNFALAPGTYVVSISGTLITSRSYVLVLAQGSGGSVANVDLHYLGAGTGIGLPLVDSSCIDDPLTTLTCINGLDVAGQGLYYDWLGDSGSQPQQYRMVVQTGPQTAALAPTTTLTGILGVAVYGTPDNAPVKVCWAGICPILFDNQANVNDWAIPSTTNAGELHDTNSMVETQGVQNFQVQKANTGAGTLGAIKMLTPDTVGSGTSGGFISPMTTDCDMIIAITGGVPARLPCPYTTGTANVGYNLTVIPGTSKETWLPVSIKPRTVASGATTDTILAADRGQLVRILATANVAASLAQAGTATFDQNWFACYVNEGTGNYTITPTTSTIGGLGAMIIPPNHKSCIYSDNSNYFKTPDQIPGTGLVNVLALTNGVPINDGSAHIVSGAPLSSPLHGVTTLTGLAAVKVNGATPFSFVTTSPFNTSGMYNLADSDVPNLDVAWLALQSSFLGGKTYVPSGTYIVGSVRNLPLLIPNANENSGNMTGNATMIQGAGQSITYIQAGGDFGSNIPLISCGDPNGTFGNSLGRYNGANGLCVGDLQDITVRSSNSTPLFSVGATTIAMTGVAWGGRLRTKDLNVEGFGKGISIVGDHTQFLRVHVLGGTYGLYWDHAQSVLAGDITFDDTMVSGQSIASIAVDPTTSISGAVFNGETYLSAPYAILGLTGGCADILTGSSFDQLFMEYVGNAFIADDNGLAASTYTDANKCRNLNGMIVNKMFTIFDNSHLWTTGGRGRRASFDVNSINIDIEHLQMQGGTLAPLGQSSGPAGIATFNVNHASSSGIGSSRIAGVINKWITNSGTLPLVAVPSGTVNFDTSIKLEEIGQWKGEIVSWPNAHGNYTVTSSGDCFEWEGFTIAPCGSNAETVNGIAGVAMQSGLTINEMVPLAQQGYTNVNGGQGSSFTTGMWKKGTGIGSPITITAAGTGGTNGTFTGVAATGGGCLTEPTFSFVVAGNIITTATITTQGVGCTSAPTLPTSASSGLSGATLTAKWPGGLITPASVFDTGALVGNNVGGGGGSWGIALQLSGQAPFPGAVNFSTLPTCNAATEGAHRAVKDSSTTTWGATITGSSSGHVQAYCDGTNWTVAAE